MSLIIPEYDRDGNLPETRRDFLCYCRICGSDMFQIHYDRLSQSYDVRCVNCDAVVSTR